MKRRVHRIWAVYTCVLMALTGCRPQQPFYLHEDGDLSHYVATVTEIENPDVEQVALEEVTQAQPPLTLSEADFQHFRDATLEECVSIALQNNVKKTTDTRDRCFASGVRPMPIRLERAWAVAAATPVLTASNAAYLQRMRDEMQQNYLLTVPICRQSRGACRR